MGCHGYLGYTYTKNYLLFIRNSHLIGHLCYYLLNFAILKHRSIVRGSSYNLGFLLLLSLQNQCLFTLRNIDVWVGGENNKVNPNMLLLRGYLWYNLIKTWIFLLT